MMHINIYQYKNVMLTFCICDSCVSGCTIYFFYGIRHSNERRQNTSSYTDLDKPDNTL